MESGSPPPPPPTISPQPPPPPPPPQPYTLDPIVKRVKNVKTICRLFMITNLGIAAYALLTPLNKKDPVAKEEKAPEPESPPPPLDFDYDPYIVPASASTELPRKPVSEDQQRELFQWMLEEKRMIKPKNKEEKKRIDKEKAILKQFIRADSIRPF